MSIPTLGHEPEPQDVENDAASWLEGATDAWGRYVRAAAGQVHHEAVVRALQADRDRALAELNASGLSYEKIADLIPGMTRSGVQKAVERGRSKPSRQKEAGIQ